MGGGATGAYLEVHDEFERACSAMIAELRQMSQKVESRLTDLQRDAKAPAVSLHLEKRREQSLRDTAEARARGAHACSIMVNNRV